MIRSWTQCHASVETMRRRGGVGVGGGARGEPAGARG